MGKRIRDVKTGRYWVASHPMPGHYACETGPGRSCRWLPILHSSTHRADPPPNGQVCPDGLTVQWIPKSSWWAQINIPHRPVTPLRLYKATGGEAWYIAPFPFPGDAQ